MGGTDRSSRRRKLGLLFALGLVLVLTGSSQGAPQENAKPDRSPPVDGGYKLGPMTEGPEEAVACVPGQRPDGAPRGRVYCPRLPKKVVPWALRTRRPAFGSEAGEGAAAMLLTGNELDVTKALPSTPFIAPFEKKCALVTPYRGASFNPCGYVEFYDSGWESSEKAPDTNVEENAQYDACGKPVGGGKTSGWHVIGTNYTLFGWHAGHEEEIPTTVSDPCLGTWTLIYKWTQTFSDSETLSDSIEVPFQVEAMPQSADDTWGGGNPSELPCAEDCYGDPVNTATGDYYETTTDLAIPGRGPGLQLTRTYSSLAARAGVSSALGRGWSFSYGMSLSVDPETGDAAITNPNGSITEFENGPEGFVAEPEVLATLVENEDGTFTHTIKRQTSYTFDSAGKLLRIADLNGNKTTFTYDESGNLETAEDDLGRTLSFQWEEESGLLSEVTDSAERSVSYAYDESGYLEEVTDVRGGHTSLTYDEDALLLTRTDPRENTALTNTYDGAGRVLTQTDGLGKTSTFSYTGIEPFTTTTVENPRGYTTEYEYDHGALVKRIVAANTGEKATWTYVHDPDTLGIIAITDPTGKTSHATYDSRGNQTSTEDETGETTESVYDSLNNLLEFTDANGVTTTYTYDENGNLLTSSTPLLGSEPPETQTTTYIRGDESHPEDVTAITDPREKTTHFTYNPAGYLVVVEDPVGNETTYTYDSLGRQLTEVRPSGNVEEAEPAAHTTTFTYDAAENRLSATDPLSHKREWTYDPNGNVATATDSNDHTTKYVYDAANRPISIERPDGQVQQTTYDANGNVMAQLDGLEHETTYSYTARDELATSTDPLGRTAEYRYYQDGKQRLKIDPQGRATFFGYNPADELVEIEDESAPDVEFEYDDNGQRISMIDTTGESSYEYDSLGRLTKAVTGHGDVTTYGYDLAGNVTSIGYPNGKTVIRGYDDASRLTSITDWLGNTTTFTYDPDSNLASKVLPEGTGIVDEYEYDRADRLTSIEVKDGAESLSALDYVRDEVGQVESLTAEGLPGPGSEAFEYDENDRLTHAGEDAFEYDDANNLIEAAGLANSFDAANQLKEAGGTAYGYDLSGQRRREGSVVATYKSAFGASGSGSGQLSHPAGLTHDSEGDIWVVDQENDRVQQFSSIGEYLSSFGTSGIGNGEFERPTDIAIDGSGHLWVTDAGNNRVEEFNQAGEYLSQFGSGGGEEGQFSEPESLAVDSEGDIWVGDTYNGRLQEFDDEGELLQVVGEFGEGEGQIYEAAAVAVDSKGDIWVADYGNARVVEFDQEGELLQQFGSRGSGNDQFEAPDAIDVDSEGNVWVVDEATSLVKKFDPSGKYLGEFGSRGSGKGEFDFGWPLGIAVGPSGDIWVSDTGNDRVQRWAPATGTGAEISYDYDEAGNLVGVERPEGGESPALEESYAYDGTGLRASQTTSATTRYLTWDQAGQLPLLLSDGDKSYIYGPDGLPLEHISEGKASYYHQDQLGSTRMLTNAAGEVTGTFSYTAYGSPAGSSGTETTPLGYAGQLANQSGLQYLRARVYDPGTGQFLTRDPLVGVTGEPYGYASNNPTSGSDPTGLCNWKPWEGDFWTEGNCLSENALNPITYYEREIEALEAGCSYWESVQYGIQGAGVLALDVLLLGAPVADVEGAIAAYWVEQFATRYPRLYLFALQQASSIGAKPPVAGTALAIFWGWMEEHT